MLFSKRDANDHFAATLPGRHDVENFGATVERADAGRPTHLVSGERQEIASHFLHIDRQMSGALRCIDQSECANRARVAAKLGHRIDRAE